MSSSFFASNGSVHLSNRRFDTLVSFAIEVARSLELTPAQSTYVEHFADVCAQMHPGFDLELEEHFSERAQQEFWAEVFSEVAQRVSAGAIGNLAPPNEWRTQAAQEATRIAKLLAELG